VEDIYIEALDLTIPLRPLTDGELERVKARAMARIRASGTSKDDEPELDFSAGEIAEDEFASNVLTVKLGMVTDEFWTEDEIESMPPGAVKEIAANIHGLTTAEPERVKSFRKQSGG